MKIVSKTKQKNNTIKEFDGMQKFFNQLNDKLVPSGLYRFSTFKEAHQWMLKMIARTHVRRT